MVYVRVQYFALFKGQAERPVPFPIPTPITHGILPAESRGYSGDSEA